MTRRGVLASAGVAAVAVFAATASDSRARSDRGGEQVIVSSEGQPQNLRVAGGEESWHPENGFRLDWTNPLPPSGLPIAAIHYCVRDAAKAVVVADTRIDWPTSLIEGLQVPDVPGTYTAEVWLEDSGGNLWASAAAKLRFDDRRPASIEPLPTAGWIGRTALPHILRLSRPSEPLPRSGIRGYAVSIDAVPNSDPCAAPDRCTEGETDLQGGIDNNAPALSELPEGTSYVHAVAVSGAGLKSPLPGSTALHVDTADPITVISGVPSGWVNRPVDLVAGAADALSGMQPTGPGGPFTAIQVDGAAPTTAPGNIVSATLIGEGIHTVAYYARDAAGNVNDAGATNGMGNRPPSVAGVRIDRTPPVASFVNAQSPADPELIEARISDSLSGPSSSKGQIAIRRAGSGEAFEPLPTEIAAGKLRAPWDSDAYPAGQYEFRATGYDAAGNAVATERRANGSDMILSNPLKIATAIQTGFGGKALVWHRCVRHGDSRSCRREVVEGFDRRPRMRIVPYGKGTVFSGRLAGGSSSPLAQMPVQIVELFASGSSESERVTTVRTGVDGTFTARLAPGPSRQILATFSGTHTLTRSSSEPIRLGVRGGVRMRPTATVATIGGRPIVFRGRIEAEDAAIPAEGKTIQLQFRLPGLPWAEFRTIQTGPSGHFHYAYRFSDDDSRGARFQFRAYAPAQSNWPYEPAASRPVAVTGR